MGGVSRVTHALVKSVRAICVVSSKTVIVSSLSVVVTMADAAELHEIISVRTFYGHKSERDKYVPVLPPENIVSDVGSSSDEEIEEVCSDLDPDFEPDLNFQPSNFWLTMT
ncbi:hypothetical protein HHI36_004059 [Cryptolaemus montrouzieri]|uniref:Uncharacterized protein n=1 Tax=Cryptolaemus montrouzieri TaxID=559131 RepID=A0ABD2NQ16_9CUCU